MHLPNGTVACSFRLFANENARAHAHINAKLKCQMHIYNVYVLVHGVWSLSLTVDKLECISDECCKRHYAFQSK